MELNAVNRISLVCNSRVLGVLGSANRVETLWQIAKLITVRHPHGHSILKPIKELVNVATEASSLQVGVAIFARRSGNNVVSVETVGDLLEAVADTEDWDAKFKEGRIDVRGVFLVDRVWATGQDNALGLPAQISQLLGAWQHLGVSLNFPQSSRDKVSAERAKLALAALKKAQLKSPITYYWDPLSSTRMVSKVLWGIASVEAMLKMLSR